MRILREAAKFLRATRRKLRIGEFSREPLQLLRLEWKADKVECDWLMRARDPWDKAVPEHLAREHQTMQALRDALALRKVIFQSFPAVMEAELRMYRMDGEGELELMMAGSVARNDGEFERVASVAMRARLCGFRFHLDAGVLEGSSRSC
jgi:hypothetical protein